jgi:FKBP-type peptidyl-prolyl cis-trans isomerase
MINVLHKSFTLLPYLCIIIASVIISGCCGPKTIGSTKGLTVEDSKIGSGKEARDGSKITVHYVGTLMDGTKFDSSRDKNRPFSFVLGDGVVIEGWDIGLQGMKVGGIRKLTISPDLGYGSEAHNKIPGNSTLLFEIELLDVE